MQKLKTMNFSDEEITQIKKKVDSEYESYDKSNDTVWSCFSPWIPVTKVGIFNIEIRKAGFGNQKATYGYNVSCGGANIKHGFTSVDGVMSAALQCAESEIKILDKAIEDNERLRKKHRNTK
mgnify:CR=1 FL=1